MKTRTPLTEIEKERAKVLHASGKSPSAIAKGMGRSHHTLQKFLDKPEIQKQVSVQREVLAAMCDSIAHRVGSSITEADITKATLQQRMVSLGIAVDKAALLRNEIPPTIHVNLLLDMVQLIRDKRTAEDARLSAEFRATLLPAPSGRTQ